MNKPTCMGPLITIENVIVNSRDLRRIVLSDTLHKKMIELNRLRHQLQYRQLRVYQNGVIIIIDSKLLVTTQDHHAHHLMNNHNERFVLPHKSQCICCNHAIGTSLGYSWTCEVCTTYIDACLNFEQHRAFTYTWYPNYHDKLHLPPSSHASILGPTKYQIDIIRPPSHDDHLYYHLNLHQLAGIGYLYRRAIISMMSNAQLCLPIEIIINMVNRAMCSADII